MIQYWIMLIFILCHSSWLIIFRNSIQDGTKFLLSMSKILSDDILESLYKSRKRESAQLKTVLELYDMEIHQKISMPDYQKIEDNGEEKYRSETSIAKLWTPGTGELNQGQWSRVERGLIGVEGEKSTCYQWKEEGQWSKGDQCSFRHENNDRAQKTRTHCRHTFRAICSHEVEVCRRKGVSKAKVTMVPFFGNRADIIWRVLARDRLLNIGILQSVNLTK